VNAPRRKSKQRRGGNANNTNNNNSNNGGAARQNRTAAPAEFWRAAPEPPEPPDIAPAEHPTALLQSMGPAPLPGQAQVANHYVEAVVQRAAILATALAASADLLADPED
jgi:hypothetical protein